MRLEITLCTLCKFEPNGGGFVPCVQGYVVLNRPWAFVQWLRKANITEEYVRQPNFVHLFCFLESRMTQLLCFFWIFITNIAEYGLVILRAWSGGFSYIMMAEPDHVFIRPLPNLATEEMPAAFKFFYIVPTEHEEVLRKFYPKEMGHISNIDPIGNSPVIIKKVLQQLPL